jgi:hypothetical protein
LRIGKTGACALICTTVRAIASRARTGPANSRIDAAAKRCPLTVTSSGTPLLTRKMPAVEPPTALLIAAWLLLKRWFLPNGKSKLNKALKTCGRLKKDGP